MKSTAVPLGALVATVIATIVHLTISALVGIHELEPFGLIHSVPLTFYVAVVAAAATTVLYLRLETQRTLPLAIAIAAFTVTVHATVTVLEPVARFPTTWLHAGHTQFIMDTHTVVPDLGARFSWPGFFVLTAGLLEPFGTVPEPVLRWAPLFFALAYLFPLYVIVRALLPGWRSAWLALTFFTIFNWVGQDYFAPQSFAFLLGLVLIAIAVTWFAGRPRLWAWRDGLFSRGGLFHPEPTMATNAPRQLRSMILAAAVITITAASLAVSHQLTPYVVAIQLLAVWAVRRGPVLTIAVLTGLMALMWLSWGASAFWVPWFSDVFGNIGNPGAVVDSTLGNRTRGNPDHLFVVALRLAFTGVIMLGALVGIVRQYRARGGLEPTVPLMIAAPFGLVLLQDYGGEGLLRAFLYALPFAAIAVACIFIPNLTLSVRSAVAVVVVVALASPVFLVARYGNESFERVSVAEVELAQCMYDTAPPDSTLGAISPHLAWQFTGLGEYTHLYRNGDAGLGFDGRTVHDYVELLHPKEGGYLIITEPQLRFVERYLGAPEGWGEAITSDFALDNRWVPVCENDAGVVYHFTPDSEVTR